MGAGGKWEVSEKPKKTRNNKNRTSQNIVEVTNDDWEFRFNQIDKEIYGILVIHYKKKLNCEEILVFLDKNDFGRFKIKEVWKSIDDNLKPYLKEEWKSYQLLLK